MATGWVKSLQCKSRASEDVVHQHHNQTNPKHHLISSSSCRKNVRNLKDVIETAKHNTPRNKKPKQRPPPPSQSRQKTESSENPTATRHSRAPHDPFLPALIELPVDHPSRNVVEIIFHTSWSPKSFSGRVEMVFKVQNLPRTVTRFEEYREKVKSIGGGGEDHARCVADGNEMMRFQCLGPSAGAPFYDCAWTSNRGKGAICTFSGSGEAHESAGGRRGRRAMLVCRVIAGRVYKQLGFDSFLEGRIGFNSVGGDNGELLVFDSRAVLPCFLIIYQL